MVKVCVEVGLSCAPNLWAGGEDVLVLADEMVLSISEGGENPIFPWQCRCKR